MRAPNAQSWALAVAARLTSTSRSTVFALQVRPLTVNGDHGAGLEARPSAVLA
jgi:hypothetical protein